MRTHEEIIRDAGGYKALAETIKLPAERVRFWDMRKCIPADSWVYVTDAGVATADELMRSFNADVEAKRLAKAEASAA